MRILLIANTLPPHDLSGVGEQVMQLADGLRGRGHEVRILGRGAGGARGPKVLFPLSIVPPAVRELREFRPDVVQVHESDGALAAAAVAVFGGVLGPRPLLVALQQVSYREEIAAVRELRDGDRVIGRPGNVEIRFRRWKAPLQVLLGRWTAWIADVVMAPSRRTAEEIERDYGVAGVELLPNVMGEKAPLAGTAEDPGREAYFLLVGRLRIRKGVEILLRALSRFGPEGPRLRIAGDGEQKPALEEAVRALGLSERVEFLGRCSADEVRRQMIGCRALVVPSTYEGMPLVILEAMEASAPIVASRASGIPEVVRDRVTGWLVPVEDVDALATALREAWDDPEEARRRGTAGRRRLEECFRPRIGAELWERIVEGRRHAS